MEEQQNFEQQSSSYSYGVPNGQPEPKGPNNLAIVSLILGIVGLLIPCVCCVLDGLTAALVITIIGLVVSIAAIVTCVMSKKEGKSGMATAGLVCGIVGIVLNLISLAALVMTLFMLSAANITLDEAATMTPDELQRRLMEWMNSVQY